MPIPIKSFEYPSALDAGSPPNGRPSELVPEPEVPANNPGVTAITENDLAAAYEKGRQEGRREAEKWSSEQLAQAVSVERTRVSEVIKEFHQGSSEYYSKVEDQVVHLALGIAAKILHRESQVDALLVAALVKIATENLKQGSHVQVNIHPKEINSWRRYFEQNENGRVMIDMVEDPTLSPGDCIVHSEVGVAALGISAQLKEIEHGLFDLLAQRPKND
jgi:flagellar assembly protein FliH